MQFLAVKELPPKVNQGPWRLPIRRADISALPAAFWWMIIIASLLSLARFSQAFLVLVASNVGIDPAFAPLVLVVMHIAFSAAAYPFGVLANHIDRRLQLRLGAVIQLVRILFLVLQAAFGQRCWVPACGGCSSG